MARIKRIPPRDKSVVRESSKPRLLTDRTKEQLREWHKEKMRFSFVHFDREHEAFNCGGTKVGWFLDLLETIKHISNLTRIEFEYHQRQHYQVHRHDWSKTSYKFDCLPPDLMEQIEDECYQFRLSTGSGRVHGFFIENTFYVVWLDPHHNMNPDERFGGLKFFDKPLSQYDEVLVELDRVRQDNEKLRQENWQLWDELIRIDTSGA